MSIIPRKYWAELHRLKIPGTQGQKKFMFQAKLGYMSRPVSEGEWGQLGGRKLFIAMPKESIFT